MPLVKWRKGYLDLRPNEEPTRGRYVLNVSNILESTNYTCVAQSDLGNIEKEVHIKVKGR
ncbi:hypothetical protein DPMN_105113 [Dreissena polymorpha]|uniref:protein-tyrosine-phosphatase n=1 Tax=Dreissena polymorpha TaxID=45954 RepID=A0A9D4H8Y8_DREPO|nr:hypothetical protein DPMN_105113 [Dreissena polymorpha]